MNVIVNLKKLFVVLLGLCSMAWLSGCTLDASLFSRLLDSDAPSIILTPPAKLAMKAEDTLTWFFSIEGSHAMTVGEPTVIFKDGPSIGCSVSHTVDVSNPLKILQEVSITGCSGNGIVGLKISTGEVKDLTGNTKTATEIFSINVDNTAPTLSLESYLGSIFNRDAFEVKIVLSEETASDIQLSDITVLNGNKTNLRKQDGSYRFDVTPISEGDVTIYIEAGKIFDMVGNSNVKSNELVFTYDQNFSPGSISISQPTPPLGTENTDFTWEITYSEHGLISLDVAKVLVSTGNDVSCAKKTVEQIADDKYQVVVGECSGSGGTIAFSVASGSAQDSYGNYFQASGASPPATMQKAPQIAISEPTPEYGTSGTVFKWELSFFDTDSMSIQPQDILLFGDSAGCQVTVNTLGSDRLDVLVSNCYEAGSLDFVIPANRVTNAAGGNAEVRSLSVFLQNTVKINVTDSLSIEDKNASGVSTRTFNFTVDPYPTPIVLKYEILENSSTATSGVHHNLQNGELTIPANSTSASIPFEYYDGSVVGTKVLTLAFVDSSVKAVTSVRQVFKKMFLDTVEGDAQFKEFSTSSFHSCAINLKDELFCWGDNSRGQLGAGDTLKKSNMVKVGVDFKLVAVGGSSTCAVKTDGSLYCWGDNSQGQLGLGDLVNRNMPALVGSSYKKIALGTFSTCAIKDDLDHSLQCWGYNSHSGQLGIGEARKLEYVLLPETIKTGFDDVKIASSSTYCALEKEAVVGAGGNIYCWGFSFGGSTGVGVTTTVWEPTKIGTTHKFKTLFAGHNSACANRADANETWCWGYSANGQLGVSQSTVSTPIKHSRGYFVEISFPSTGTACGVRDGTMAYECWGHTAPHGLVNSNYTKAQGACVLNGKNVLFCTGGSMMNGHVDTFSDWVPIKKNIDQVALGNMGYALGMDGKLFLWGSAAPMGNTLSPSYSPVAFLPFLIDRDFQSISTGGNTACGIKAGGHLYCWGSNTDKFIYPTMSGRTIQSPKFYGTGYKSVTVGGGYICAIQNLEDTLVCWGSNYYGELGSGVIGGGGERVTVGTNFKRVQASNYLSYRMTCALDAEDSLYCWGDNSFGQLGNGTTNAGPASYKVFENVLDFSVGAMHVCAIDSQRKLYCWGNGDSGKLGLGNNSSYSAPQQVGGVDYVSVVAGGSQSCAVKTNGDVYCWGANLGTFGGGFTSLPKKVGEGFQSVVIANSSSSDRLCGIKVIDSELYCAGQNTNGSIGNGILSGGAPSFIYPGAPL